MVDALTAPGMAIEARLSASDVIQKLNTRLAHILGGELARLRADSVFAHSMNLTVQAPTEQQDSLRAQQISALSNQHIGLSTQTTMYAEGARTAAHHFNADELRQTQMPDSETCIFRESERERGEQGEGEQEASEQEEHEYGPAAANEWISELYTPQLSERLGAALVQFQDLGCEVGLTGSPCAFIMPAQHWINLYAPADIRFSFDADLNRTRDVLILCLAFDGTMGELGIVMGAVFRGDACIGTVQATWSAGGEELANDCFSVLVPNPHPVVSHFTVRSATELIGGIRVKIDGLVLELSSWEFKVNQCSWL